MIQRNKMIQAKNWRWQMIVEEKNHVDKSNRKKTLSNESDIKPDFLYQMEKQRVWTHRSHSEANGMKSVNSVRNLIWFNFALCHDQQKTQLQIVWINQERN